MVLNNFAAGGEALALTATLFQGLFPPINVQKTSLAGCKVCQGPLLKAVALLPGLACRLGACCWPLCNLLDV